jgi:hypothetical protein
VSDPFVVTMNNKISLNQQKVRSHNTSYCLIEVVTKAG